MQDVTTEGQSPPADHDTGLMAALGWASLFCRPRHARIYLLHDQIMTKDNWRSLSKA